MANKITTINTLISTLKAAFSSANPKAFNVFTFNKDKAIANYSDALKTLLEGQLKLSALSIDTLTSKEVTEVKITNTQSAALIKGNVNVSTKKLLGITSDKIGTGYLYFWLDSQQNIQSIFT